MGRFLSVAGLLLLWAGAAGANGLLIPVEKTVPPLAMLNHLVTIHIDEQVAETKVEQTFRNHTDRALEATYVFPIPKEASVQKFTMQVDGKDVKGELVEAEKARQMYTEVVRRTQDPGLLEYMGHNVLRLKVFPVPAHGDVKVTVDFSSLAPRESGVVEYVYPLKSTGKATRTLEKFAILATIKSEHPIQNVYSPTHSITVTRPSDREAKVTFDREQGLLDKDFQLYYAVGDKDVGLSALTHRPIASEPGYALMLLSPRVEISKSQVIPRDMVMVLDTSGSMRGVKMEQARKALKYCLSNLNPQDRFGVLNFASTVNKYRDGLVPAEMDQLEQAQNWVDHLEANGGTAINDALAAALALRTSDMGRSFTIVFFTDGCPTVGETNPDKILKNVAAKNTANTRIFTFGVGDDVNATMLDQLADQTRAVSTYVRPAEDIEVKVSGLYAKISNPVLTDVKVVTTGDVHLEEMYPPQLPDLFAGGQVVVLSRYTGKGPTAIKLTGMVGMEPREFVFELTFPEKSKNDDRAFVEPLWGRRKVGYILDQIRANGEKKELVDEVVTLAKKYGIATPYTSYLVMPDAPVPIAQGRAGGAGPRFGAGINGGLGGGWGGPGGVPPALQPATATNAPRSVAQFARENTTKPGELSNKRGAYSEKELAAELKKADGGRGKGEGRALREALDKKQAYDQARLSLARKDHEGVQTGKLGVDLSIQTNNLRNQSRLERTAQRNVNQRNCLEIGGVWIDEGYAAKTPTLAVKAMSEAYFRILERQPKMREVFQLGNHLVWLTPSGTALIIDTSEGKDKLTDAEIDKLFVAKK